MLELKRQQRLEEIPGVSKIISGIIAELLETGTCRKMEQGDEFFTPPPKSVLEMTTVPRLGAKTAKMLYQEHQLASLADLKKAAQDGTLQKINGIGNKMIEAINEHQLD